MSGPGSFLPGTSDLLPLLERTGASLERCFGHSVVVDQVYGSNRLVLSSKVKSPVMSAPGLAEPDPVVVPPHPWEYLVKKLDLQPYEIAHALAVKSKDVPWTEVMEELDELVIPATDLSRAEVFAELVTAIEPAFALVVVGDMVGVMYGLSETPALHDSGKGGGLYSALLGEVRHVYQMTYHPGLHRFAGVTTRAGHEALVGTVVVRTKTPEEIWEDIERAPPPKFVEPRPAGKKTKEGVQVYRLLPVHPKIACLFMRPTPAREAFMRMGDLVDAITETVGPDAHDAGLERLMNFASAAVTRAAGETVSLINSGLVPVSLTPGSPMERRHGAALSRYIVIAPPPEVEPPVVPRPGGAGNSPVAGNPPDIAIPSATAPVDAGAEPAKTRQYHLYELRKIWSLAGAKAEDFPLLTSSALPQFWQDFLPYRKGSASRTFVEGYFRDHLDQMVPTGGTRLSKSFVLTAGFIRTLQDLNFTGTDPHITWGRKHLGLSFYSMAPVDSQAAASDRYLQAHDETAIYELAELDGTLTMADRRQQRASMEFEARTPETRESLIRFLDGTESIMRLLFGDDCVILKHVQAITTAICDGAACSSWDRDGFRGTAWAIHAGVRRVLLECTQGCELRHMDSLRMVEMDVRAWRSTPLRDAPIQLQALSGDRGTKRGPADASPGTQRDSKLPALETRTHALSKNFQALLAKAKDATRVKRNFTLNKVMGGAGKVHEVLGPEFATLGEGGKEPCGYAFLDPRGCSNRTCKFAHTLKSEPPPPVVAAMVRRVTTAVDAYIAKQGES